MKNDTLLELNAVDVVDHILKVAAMDTSESAVPQELFISSMTMASIAISLKRIADAVSGVPYDPAPGADNSRHCMGLTDGIMHAIEQGLLAASQRG